MGTSDPVFQKRIKEHGLDLANPDDMQKIGELWIDQVWHGTCPSLLRFTDSDLANSLKEKHIHGTKYQSGSITVASAAGSTKTRDERPWSCVADY